MTNRRDFLRHAAAAGVAGTVGTRPQANANAPEPSGSDDRAYWISVVKRIADPVLVNLSQRKLKAVMPVEAKPQSLAERLNYTHLEAISRLLAGIAPWLELPLGAGAEGELRRKYAELARQCMSAATDPQSPDYMNFTKGSQPLVDAAFLAYAVVRSPTELWDKLDQKTKDDLIEALKATRAIRPGFNNWLLFSAMVEAALKAVGQPDWDRMRIDYAVRQHEQWYKGDGVYGDGPDFRWDYYNSFVIHPMMIDVLKIVSGTAREWDAISEKVLIRARRHADIQERLISPEGTFPAIGRSLSYRYAAFHLLGQMALMRQLPEHIKPAQVRCALTAVIRRMTEAPGTFDSRGWLTIGFSGHQPGIGESYISTGSLYGCTLGLLPLGLPPDDEFWTGPPADWSSKKVWSGKDVAADRSL